VHRAALIGLSSLLGCHRAAPPEVVSPPAPAIAGGSGEMAAAEAVADGFTIASGDGWPHAESRRDRPTMIAAGRSSRIRSILISSKPSDRSGCTILRRPALPGDWL
jgi:hypothetical protein